MTSEMQRRPRRRLDAVRRPHILATAVELIREKGLWTVRISDIAKRAGMSPANVVYYFGSKDQLLAEAISDADDAFYDRLGEELPQIGTAAERLARLVVRSSTSDWLLWVDLWVYARFHPDTAVAQRGFHLRWRRSIQTIVEFGVETGEWKADEPAGVSQRLAAVSDGLAVHMLLGDPDHSREQYVTMFLTAASLELAFDLAELERAAAECPLPELPA